jgi:hypothetical protein
MIAVRNRNYKGVHDVEKDDGYVGVCYVGVDGFCGKR